MIKYNLKALVKIECSDFIESGRFSYDKEIKRFGIKIQKTAIWDNYLCNILEDIPKNYILKDDVIYEKPNVTLWYIDNHNKTYYFESFDEAKQFADNITQITSINNWIE